MFKIGTDIHQAQVLVQNRVSSVPASLPQSVQMQGVSVQQQSTAVLMFVALSIAGFEIRQPVFRDNYATINLNDPRALARLPGVGNVSVLGAGQYSMRVWLDPNELYSRSLTTDDVINALKTQNQQVTAGELGTSRHRPRARSSSSLFDVNGRLQEATQFEDIVVKTEQNGRMMLPARCRARRARLANLR